jgi:hypothetical protein
MQCPDMSFTPDGIVIKIDMACLKKQCDTQTRSIYGAPRYVLIFCTTESFRNFKGNASLRTFQKITYFFLICKARCKNQFLRLCPLEKKKTTIFPGLLNFFTYSVVLQSLKDLGRLTYCRFLKLFRHLVGFLGRVISPS